MCSTQVKLRLRKSNMNFLLKQLYPFIYFLTTIQTTQAPGVTPCPPKAAPCACLRELLSLPLLCPFLSCNPSLAGAGRNDEVEADTCLSFPNYPPWPTKYNYQIMPGSTTASLAIRGMAQEGHQPSQHLLLQVPGQPPPPKASASHRHWQDSTQHCSFL